MTLNDALQECARNTRNTKIMVLTNGAYTGTGLEYATRFLSGINECMRKIARERVAPEATQDITLDDHGLFDVTTLPNQILRVKGLIFDEDRKVVWKETEDDKIIVPSYEGATMKIVYEYLPREMTLETDLDEDLRINDRNVEGKVLCYYANFKFLSEWGTEYDSARSAVWLNLFTDGFNEIERTFKRPRQVTYRDSVSY